MSQQITWNFEVIREFLVYLADFQQISTSEPNLTTKLGKFYFLIFIAQSVAHNDSKKVFFIEIHPRKPKISLVLCQKTCELDKNPSREKIMTLFDFTRFLPQNGRYLWLLWMDFDEKYLFGIFMSYTLSNKN